MKDDTISRAAAIDAVNSLIDRFERILSDIRESRVDDSVCGMCEYDGAFVGESGNWCNECPGFEKDDCFKLSDECRKRWLESVKLPSAQPEKRTDKRTETHACDLISRQAAIDVLMAILDRPNHAEFLYTDEICKALGQLPPAQPEIIRCKDCEYGEQDEIGRWYCRGLGCQMGDDDGNGFCSGAEKREE